ncbi:MAG: efflux RND transporter periplasmic adaptor subunit [Gemmatimonadaceae bacterium]|nr:efflux RND transporter periplasmic adaptor subunit [Gemmatimonadaceae bacterium]
MQVLKVVALISVVALVGACGGAGEEEVVKEAIAAPPAGTLFVVRDSSVRALYHATAVAEPYAQAIVSTKLMGTVLAVQVREGDRVSAGQSLVRIDARDLDARRQQVQAGIASAEAMYQEAQLMAVRMRALHADSAAPKVQLDAAEAGLARAQAGLSSANAGRAELDAIAGYAVVRAPFAGVVTQRWVDVGAFAAPGAPLLTVQDNARLRVAATVPPNVARGVGRGARVEVSVEGVTAMATVEGVVPTAGGSLYTINAIVDNRRGALMAGGAARLSVGEGKRSAILVPSGAVRREGDLPGVLLKSGATTTTRWIRVGGMQGNMLEVLSGLVVGDTVLVPNAPARE